MNYDPANPLIVQGDRTVLVEVDNPKYAEARDALAPFAELEKSPEHIHTYRLSDLSLWNAAAAGVTDKATFEKADLFESDFSKAQVITMFLLPSINMRLRPTILKMRPGTRVVSNTFTMEDWQPDQTETIGGDCTSWCTANLLIVPAQVQGTWQVGQNALTLKQTFQNVEGTLGSTAISNGMYSGRHPAITPLTATLSMVASRPSCGRILMTSPGSRSVNVRNASTR